MCAATSSIAPGGRARRRRWTSFLYILFFLPAVAAWIYAGWAYAQMSDRDSARSASSAPPAFPVFPLKALIPLAGVLLLIQGIAEIIRCISASAQGAWPQRLHDVEEMETVILHEQQYLAEHGERRSRGRARGLGFMTDPQIGISMLVLFIFMIMLGFPDRLHADGDGRELRLLRLLHARPGGVRQSRLHAAGAEDLRGRVQRRAHLRAVFTFMGYIIDRANILDRMFHSLQLAIGGLPGCAGGRHHGGVRAVGHRHRASSARSWC